MTYCLGILVEDGLLMMADTRTNAGIDNVSSYRKLHCLTELPDRQIFIASCGSLSASQALIGRLMDEAKGESQGLEAAASMSGAAEIVGEALRAANKALFEGFGSDRRPGGATLLLGGRIGSERPRLFQIYAEGNYIECMPEVPFLQIGETKYGRAILDRVISVETPLSAAIKTGLLSFDSAMRSNLAIALPIDLAVIPASPASRTHVRRVDEHDGYFQELSLRWSRMLINATEQMPEPRFVVDLGTPKPLTLVTDLRA